MTVTIILTLQHKPPFPAAPAIGWIIMALCMLGFNRKEQIRQCVMLPFAALLTAWICTLL